MKFSIAQLCVLAVFLLVGMIPTISAQRDDSRGKRSAELHPCDQLQDTGKRLNAADCYRNLLTHGSLATRAEAFWMLGDLKSANDKFREAVEADQDNPDLRVRWGYLYSVSHQHPEAGKLFEEALALDSEHIPARLGMASVMLNSFDGKAVEIVKKTLEDQPKQVEAHLLLARMSLEEGNHEDAEKSLEKALEQAHELKVAPLEAYSLLASLEMLRGNPDNKWIDKALSYNPSYGEIYSEQAHFYVITRRYREATGRLRHAVRIDPQLWQAHAELGVNLMRGGHDEEGQRHLEIAYNGDPYSAKTVNTLRLIDNFDDFLTHSSRDNDQPGVETRKSESPSEPELLVKIHRDESGYLLSYVQELSQRAIKVFTDKYGFTLERPVRVELFPNHDDFAVRTMAMPGIGLLGVTFGYVVAMDSPTARESGAFHWGTTLWHELAHVFTLESTNHLVPRWYSEGISMYEEWLGDPRWGESLFPEYIQAFKAEKLLPVADLDRGFIRPRYPGQVGISYLQAGYICQFIAKQWGEHKLVELLNAFAEKVTTDENIHTVLEVAPEEFDQQFNEYMKEFMGPALEGLPNWQSNLKKALEAAAEKNWQAVFEPANTAREAFPQHVGSGSAYVLLSKASEETGDETAAIEHLLEYEKRGGRQPETLKKLAYWLAEKGRTKQAIHTYEGLLYNRPQDEELHTRLGELLLKIGKAEQARREFQAVLALDPHDQAMAQYNLARAYVKINDFEKARLHVLQSLENAPTFRPALRLLLEVKR